MTWRDTFLNNFLNHFWLENFSVVVLPFYGKINSKWSHCRGMIFSRITSASRIRDYCTFGSFISACKRTIKGDHPVISVAIPRKIHHWLLKMLQKVWIWTFKPSSPFYVIPKVWDIQQLKSRSTEKHEVIGPKAICIWSV